MSEEDNTTVWFFEQIKKGVNFLVRKVSFKFEPEKTVDAVESNMLIALKHICHNA